MANKRKRVAKPDTPTETESLLIVADELKRIARAVAFAGIKDASDTEQAFHLNQSGFTPSEIAQMFGEKTNVITARISNARRTRETRAKKPKQD